MTRESTFSSNHVSLVQHGGAGVVANCAGPLSCLLLISHYPLVPLSSHLPPPRSFLLFKLCHRTLPICPVPFLYSHFPVLKPPMFLLFLLQLASHLMRWMLSFYTNPPLSRHYAYPSSSKAHRCPNIDRYILPPYLGIPLARFRPESPLPIGPLPTCVP